MKEQMRQDWEICFKDISSGQEERIPLKLGGSSSDQPQGISSAKITFKVRHKKNKEFKNMWRLVQFLIEWPSSSHPEKE